MTDNGTGPLWTAATRKRGYWPPPLEYYAARIELGMPSGAEALFRSCPWCGAAKFEACHVPGTRRPRRPHEARTEDITEETPLWASATPATPAPTRSPSGRTQHDVVPQNSGASVAGVTPHGAVWGLMSALACCASIRHIRVRDPW